MRICIAQTKPIKGEIIANIDNHKKMIDVAILNNADIIVFPELSLTGYEPELVKELATNQDNNILDDFQKISDTNKIIICVGLPTNGDKGILISMIIFQPNAYRQTYSKQHLHPGEETIFTVGHDQIFLTKGNNKIAPAICYETSVAEHSEYAFKNGANIYIASVLNSINSVDKDIERLSQIAKKYKMTTFMSNFVGQSGNYECAGKSSIWNNEGVLIGQLDDKEEGILIYDTETMNVNEEKINCH